MAITNNNTTVDTTIDPGLSGVNLVPPNPDTTQPITHIDKTYVESKTEITNLPGGNANMVQYSSGGVFKGDSGLVYDPVTKSLTVRGNINLGGYLKGKLLTNFNNFKLSGGAPGQVLVTDGMGNLSWADQTGGGTNYSNSNVASYLPTYDGNITGGNIAITGGVYSFDISSTGTSFLTNLNVNAESRLGDLGNVKITGGTNGQVIVTDGNGNLSWASPSVSTNYANSNVANYLPTYTGNLSGGNLTVTTNVTTQAVIIPNLGDTFDSGITTADQKGRLYFGLDTGFNIVTNDTWAASFGADGRVTFPAGYRFPNNRGTNNQILSINNVGDLHWVNPQSGPQGNAATISVGTVVTGAPGTSASVTNSGNSTNAVFDFSIPKGDTGSQGPKGDAGTSATVNVGTVTTGNAGTQAIVTNVGTTHAAIFDFTIPKGEHGDKGDKGDQGIQGEQGIQGVKGDKGDQGERGLQGPKGDKGDTGLTGATGPKGDKGDQGVPGNDSTVPGPKGDTGEQGVSVTLIGSVATSQDLPIPGGLGQGYIVNDTGNLWFWNSLTTSWNDIGKIVGPQGDKGDPGPKGDKGDQGVPGNDGQNGSPGANGSDGIDGNRGSVWFSGSENPLATIEGLQDLDFYFKTSDNTVWQYAAGIQTWYLLSNITGPQGPQGNEGPQGNPGEAGHGVALGGTEGQILVKVSNADYDTAWVDQISSKTIISDVAPDNQEDGTLWYNSVQGRSYILYNQQWIDASPQTFDPTAVRLNDNGDLEVPQNIITTHGRMYQDGSEGKTSIRWVNINSSNELLRAYSDGFSGGYEQNEIATLGVNFETQTNTGVYLRSYNANGPVEWDFNSDGTVTIPNGAKIGGIQYPDGVDLYADANLYYAQINYDNRNFIWAEDQVVGIEVNGQDWYFTDTGMIIFPDGTIQETAFTGDKDARVQTVDFPPSAVEGTLWWNSEAGRLFVKYQNQWIDANPQTLDPSAIRADEDGLINLPTGGQIGNAQRIHQNAPGGRKGVDLYASTNERWVQLNYNEDQYVWADETAAYIDTGFNTPGVQGKSWRFDKQGNITFPDQTVQTTAYQGPATLLDGGGADATYVSDIPPSGVINPFNQELNTSDNVRFASVTADNFIGTVNLANSVVSVPVGNITGLGNLSLVNADGNSSNVLYGNGVFAAAPSGGGGVSTVANQVVGNGSYNNPNLIQVNNSDSNWALGFYSDNSSQFYAQVKYWGDGTANRGFRILDSASGTTVLMVNENGITFSDNSVQSTAFTGTINVANVSGIGNIATVNLDGNSSNILYGNGVFAAAPVTGTTYGDSNVATYLTNNPQPGTYSNSNVSSYITTYNGNVSGISVTGSFRVIRAVPTTLSGDNGDTVGALAFDNDYIYRCTATWVDQHYSAMSNTLYTMDGVWHIDKGSYPTPQVGWTITGQDYPLITDHTGTITSVTDEGATWGIRGTGIGNNGVISAQPVVFHNPVYPTIWQRMPWTATNYSDSNVATYLSANPQPGTYSNSNVATYLTANPQPGTYSNSNVATYLTANPQPGTYSNSNVTSYLATTSVPQANIASNVVVGNASATAFAFPVLLGNIGNVQISGSNTLKYNPSTSALSGIQTIVAGQSVQTTSILAAAGAAAVFNTTATTINIGGAANVANIGASNVVATFGGGTGNIVAGNINAVNGTLTGNLAVSGNITGANITGNINITGNVTGTSANVTLVAGSYSTVFDNTGVATMPGVIKMASLPAFRVYGTSSTDIAAGNVISATYGITIDYNQTSSYNNTTGLFTAPVAGLYHTSATVRVGTNNGLNQAAIIKNSGGSGNVVAFWETDTNTGTATHFGMSGYIKLAVGDTLKLQSVAGKIQFDANDSWSVAFVG